jgi:hypothetical protein
VNIEAMNEHLAEISRRVSYQPPGPLTRL